MTMRYRALVDSVMHGDEVDRCPVLFWKHHPIADQSAEGLSAATIDFQECFDLDIVKISPAATYQLPDYGLLDSWQGDPIGRRRIDRTVVQHPEDWRKLPRLDSRKGFASRFVTCADQVRRHFPAQVPVIITVFNPLFQAVTLAGVERLQTHMLQCPDAVEEGLDRLLENTLDLIGSLRAHRVDGIFLASQHALQHVFSADCYARFGLPGDRACLQAASGLPLNMLHIHGSPIHGSLFEDIEGVTLHYDATPINPAPRHFWARGRAISTGPSPDLLGCNPPVAQVRAECDRILAGRDGARLILSPGCSVPLAVEADRLDAIIASARAPLHK